MLWSLWRRDFFGVDMQCFSLPPLEAGAWSKMPIKQFLVGEELPQLATGILKLLYLFYKLLHRHSREGEHLHRTP